MSRVVFRNIQTVQQSNEERNRALLELGASSTEIRFWEALRNREINGDTLSSLPSGSAREDRLVSALRKLPATFRNKDIRTLLHCNSKRATRLLDEMERMGLILRVPDSYAYALTEQYSVTA